MSISDVNKGFESLSRDFNNFLNIKSGNLKESEKKEIKKLHSNIQKHIQTTIKYVDNNKKKITLDNLKLMGEYLVGMQKMLDVLQNTTSFQNFIEKNELKNKPPELLANDYVFKKIPYDKLQAGDIVCTYESLSTVPSVLRAAKFQKYMSPEKRENLNKFIHFEIITEKLKRKGIYKIAHASGNKNKVVEENENFKKYDPGQAIAVIRPKNKLIRKAIVENARLIAESGNPWGIRLEKDKTVGKKVKHLLKSVKFERFSKTNKKDFARAVEMTLDLVERGAIYKKDKKTLKMMNCAQFTASVISISVIKTLYKGILEDAKLTLEQKKKMIVSDLRKLDLKHPDRLSPPIRFTDPSISSASFVEFLLSQANDFEGVGYIGSFSKETIEKKCLIDRLSNKPVDIAKLTKDIGRLFPRFDQKLFLQVLQSLALINNRGHVFEKNVDNQEKLNAAISAYISIAYKVSLDRVHYADNFKNLKENFNEIKQPFQKLKDLNEVVIKKKLSNSEAKKLLQPVLVKLKPYVKELEGKGVISRKGKILNYDKKDEEKLLVEIYSSVQSKIFKLSEKNIVNYFSEKDVVQEEVEHILTNQPKILNALNATLKSPSDKTQEQVEIDELSIDEKLVALRAERNNIKYVNSKDKNKKLAFNFLDQKIAKAKDKKKSGRLLLIIAIACLISPFSIILLAIAAVMLKTSSREIAFLHDWKARIESTHKEVQPNAQINLKTRVDFGERPWIVYSNDSKGTNESWDVEPFSIKPGTEDRWTAKLDLKDGVQYKLFIGPRDENDPDPINKARAWQKTHDGNNVVVNSMDLKRNENMFQLPECVNPEWE